jgi:LPS export ABC transporter protein LptC
MFGITIFLACSFDYGEASQDDGDQPDIVMQDVEYVRMRDGYPVVRFSAEEAQRFEKKQAMELDHFRFEQFETHADSVSATGSATLASIELESGNIRMEGGVYIEVESEDIAITTTTLEWLDKERQLSTGETEQVDITRSDGTSFTGWGFFADARRRSWEFKNGVEGTYVEKDDEEESEDSAGADEGSDSAAASEAEAVPAAPAASPAAKAAAPAASAASPAAKAAPAAPAAAPAAPAAPEKTEKGEETGEEYPEKLPAILEGIK